MAYNFQPFKDTVKKIEEHLKKELQTISTGRANPALLDSVLVEAYGSMQPVKNVGTISIEEARVLRIAPWDTSLIKLIEKAILDSKLPVSVATDDKGIRVSIPQVTEESKQSLIKLVRQKLEEARVQVRMERQTIDKDIDAREKEKSISEDDKFRSKELLQKCTDEANNALDTVAHKKEEDIVSI